MLPCSIGNTLRIFHTKRLRLWQRGCRIVDQPTGRLDRSAGATPIPQRSLPKRLFCPLVWLQQLVRFQQTLRFDPILTEMWVKDRLESTGLSGPFL
jgi:hypothetical protein